MPLAGETRPRWARRIAHAQFCSPRARLAPGPSRSPGDYSPTDHNVVAMLKGLKRPRSGRSSRFARVDWREYCPAVEDQQNLASSTAHACVGLVQYLQRRATGKLLKPSRLFLYKMTRRLLHRTGDTGANLQATLKAMVRFGIPPEQYWPYDTAKFDDEPDSFLFSFAPEYSSIICVRLDPRGATGSETLGYVKSYLAAGFPSMFGFTMFNSLSEDADIPFPTIYDSVRGGQGVAAVGYDDRCRIRSTKGPLLIRNPLGPSWGDTGYGWLPYLRLHRRTPRR